MLMDISGTQPALVFKTSKTAFSLILPHTLLNRANPAFPLAIIILYQLL